MNRNKIYDWEKEFETLTLSDKRLKQRLLEIMEDLSTSPDASIFLASGSRSDAKAVYRFLSNDTVKIPPILENIKQSAFPNPALLSHWSWSANVERLSKQGSNCRRCLSYFSEIFSNCPFMLIITPHLIMFMLI